MAYAGTGRHHLQNLSMSTQRKPTLSIPIITCDDGSYINKYCRWCHNTETVISRNDSDVKMLINVGQKVIADWLNSDSQKKLKIIHLYKLWSWFRKGEGLKGMHLALSIAFIPLFGPDLRNYS